MGSVQFIGRAETPTGHVLQEGAGEDPSTTKRPIDKWCGCCALLLDSRADARPASVPPCLRASVSAFKHFRSSRWTEPRSNPTFSHQRCGSALGQRPSHVQEPVGERRSRSVRKGSRRHACGAWAERVSPEEESGTLVLGLGRTGPSRMSACGVPSERVERVCSCSARTVHGPLGLSPMCRSLQKELHVIATGSVEVAVTPTGDGCSQSRERHATLSQRRDCVCRNEPLKSL